MEAHHPETNRALARGRIFGLGHFIGRPVDKVLQNVIQKPHDVGNEARILAPGRKMLQIERRQAADRGPLVAQMIGARGQGNLGAQIRGFDRQAGQLLMLRQLAVYGIGKDKVGLAQLDPRGQQPNP